MIRLTNKSTRSIGLAGVHSVVLEVGGSVEVSAERYQDLERNPKLLTWIDRGYIEVEAVPGEPAAEVSDLPKGVSGEGIELHHRGGGWWSVFVNGIEVTDKGVLKDEAKKIAAEYE